MDLNAIVRLVDMLNAECQRLSREVNRLTEIDKAHKVLNGQLRSELNQQQLENIQKAGL